MYREICKLGFGLALLALLVHNFKELSPDCDLSFHNTVFMAFESPFVNIVLVDTGRVRVSPGSIV